MSTNKLTTLEQLKLLATRVKSEDDVLAGKIAEIAADIEGIVATGGEANVLEGVKVNGRALAITDKMVDLLIASGTENGTISVNGAAVAIKGLQALAYKAQISESDLDAALKASIAAKATQADLSALTVRVTTAEGDITELQGSVEALRDAGYQTAAQVEAIAQAAVAASGHAKFVVAESDPTAEGFAAQDNVMYLYMNAGTGHYDIYAKAGGSVVLLDDTTVDLSQYPTEDEQAAAITAAIEALNIGDYAKAADLLAAVERITAVEARFADHYTKTEIDAKLEGYATDEEAAAAASAAVTAAQATDEEVSAMLDEVFRPEA